MNPIADIIKIPEKQKDIFATFAERQSKYTGKAVKVDSDVGEEDYIDKFEKDLQNPQSNAYRYAIAGAVTLVLGGLGVFLGRKNHTVLVEKLGETAARLKDRAKLPDAGFLTKIKAKAAGGAESFFNGYYAFDKVIKDTGLMQVFKGLDNGLKKIGLSFLKPGEWLIKASKWSLHFTKKSIKTLYWDAERNIRNADDYLKSSYGHLTPEERQVFSRALKFIENGTFQRNIEKLRKGTDERLDELSGKVIERQVIQPYLKNYVLKKPENLSSLKSWKGEFKRIYNNWRGAFKRNKPDVLRENWDDIEKQLREKIRSTSINNASLGQSMDELDDILRELKTFKDKNKGASELFDNVYAELEKAKSRVERAINCEVSGRDTSMFTGSYAGRAIDLGAGGGITETLIPFVTGGIIAANTVKNAEKDDSPGEIIKKFFGNGGFEFAGSLVAWFATSVMLMMNGAPAMAASAATALGLNVVKNTFNKITGKTEDKETEIQPEKQK